MVCSGCPQATQKRALGLAAVPQRAQRSSIAAPHCSQNRAPLGFSAPHAVHRIALILEFPFWMLNQASINTDGWQTQSSGSVLSPRRAAHSPVPPCLFDCSGKFFFLLGRKFFF